MRYLISFDIVDKKTNRKSVNKKLRCIGAKRVLRSQWVLRRKNTKFKKIYKELVKLFSANDRILIAPLNSFVSRKLLTKIKTI